MFNTLRNAWKVPDIRKKILYTLMMLLVYRIGAHVPTPGVDAAYMQEAVGSSYLGSYLDLFSGGALSNLSLFALGITPYITASIIMNLLTMALPPLERLSKEGPEGRKKIASITRYAAVTLGLIQSIAVVLSYKSAVLDTGTPMIFNYITIVLCLTAGTALIMWIGENITENGVGNGISLIIFISIVSRVPSATISLFNSAGLESSTTTYGSIVVVLVAVLVIITGITFIDLGERRIPVQYAKRVIGRKMYGGQSTHIPMKINQSGVLPLIFAMTLIQFPLIIVGFMSSETQAGYEQWMGSDKPLYLILFALLIFFFTFFYSQATFNPIDVSKNMQQNGGFIPGIRAGKPTSDYLQKILVRVTLFGALFLAVVATVPTALSAMAGVENIGFGATSLLIMVSVSLETTRQLESQMMMRNYKGFLK